MSINTTYSYTNYLVFPARKALNSSTKNSSNSPYYLYPIAKEMPLHYSDHNVLIKPFCFGDNESAIREKIQKFFDAVKHVDIYITPSYQEPILIETPEAQQAAKEFEMLNTLSLEEKKIFIEEYKELTGWPNISKCSNNILKHLKSVINDSAEKSGVKTIVAGYDKACSLAKYDAIPGSDADKLFIIIESCDDNKKKYFESLLKDKANRFIMSYSAKDPAFVITLDKFKEYSKIANVAYEKMTQNLSEIEKEKQETKLENLVYTEDNDFTKAAEFNLKLKKFLPKDIDLKEFRKVCFSNEILRHGISLFDNLKLSDKEFIEKSPLFKLSNMSQQLGKKDTIKIKTRMRKIMSEKFNSLDTQEQFEFIKTMLLAGFDHRPPKGSKYGDCFHNFGDKTPYGETQNSDMLKKLFFED